MPNWCEGNIRFRGACKDIKALVENELVCVGTVVGERNWDVVESKPVVDTDGYQLSVRRSDNGDGILFPAFHIKGTRRNFLDGITVEFDGMYESDDEREVRTLICSSFKAAWGIEAQPYVELSKKYDVDIHIFGWERNMEFAQEVEILRGELVKDEEIKYDDWQWECPMAYLGG